MIIKIKQIGMQENTLFKQNMVLNGQPGASVIYTYMYTYIVSIHIYTYIYIHMYVDVCVDIYITLAPG